MHVIQALVIIHPDFSQTHRVSTVNIAFPWEKSPTTCNEESLPHSTFQSGHVVGMARSKDMTNTRARNEFQTATTHPNTEGDLQIFTTPNLWTRALISDAFVTVIVGRHSHSRSVPLTSMSSSKREERWGERIVANERTVTAYFEEVFTMRSQQTSGHRRGPKDEVHWSLEQTSSDCYQWSLNSAASLLRS